MVRKGRGRGRGAAKAKVVEDNHIEEEVAEEVEETSQEAAEAEEAMDDAEEQAEVEEPEDQEEEEEPEEAEEETEDATNEEHAEEEAEEEDADEDAEEDGDKKERRPNNYLTTHADYFGQHIMREIKNDYNTANRRVNFRQQNQKGKNQKNSKEHSLRIRQKRSQLCLDVIVCYGEKEYRNCSSLALMTVSHSIREAIIRHRKNIQFGKRDKVPENLHHCIIKADEGLGVEGLRSVLKWAHTGDLLVTKENFESIVATVLYFRIKLLRQKLCWIARKIGCKFIPVPASEKTIARRKAQGKPSLPDGTEEAQPEFVEGDGEEFPPLADDAPVFAGKDILEKIKKLARIDHLAGIPGVEKKKADIAEKKAEKAEKRKAAANNRKRANTDSSDKPSDAKKAKPTQQNGNNNARANVKSEDNNKNNKSSPVKREGNNTRNNAGRGGHGRGGARGGARGGGQRNNTPQKSIYRDNQPMRHQPPPQYAAQGYPQQGYPQQYFQQGYGQPMHPQYQYPNQQNPYNGQQNQGRGGYYGY